MYIKIIVPLISLLFYYCRRKNDWFDISCSMAFRQKDFETLFIKYLSLIIASNLACNLDDNGIPTNVYHSIIYISYFVILSHEKKGASLKNACVIFINRTSGFSQNKRQYVNNVCIRFLKVWWRNNVTHLPTDYSGQNLNLLLKIWNFKWIACLDDHLVLSKIL